MPTCGIGPRTFDSARASKKSGGSAAMPSEIVSVADAICSAARMSRAILLSTASKNSASCESLASLRCVADRTAEKSSARVTLRHPVRFAGVRRSEPIPRGFALDGIARHDARVCGQYPRHVLRRYQQLDVSPCLGRAGGDRLMRHKRFAIDLLQPCLQLGDEPPPSVAPRHRLAPRRRDGRCQAELPKASVGCRIVDAPPPIGLDALSRIETGPCERLVRDPLDEHDIDRARVEQEAVRSRCCNGAYRRVVPFLRTIRNQLDARAKIRL